MPKGRRTTRRAALACIGSGAVLLGARTVGVAQIRSDRPATLETVSDPNAYLGIDGIGSVPHEEVQVSNNASSTLEVTVSTANFTIGGEGGPRSTTVSLAPGGTQTVEFFPEHGNRDGVDFTADVVDGGSDVGTIELSRTVTIPFQAGQTYRIESVHNGYVWDVDGSANNPGANLIVYGYHGGTNQQFEVVENSDGTYRFEPQHANRAIGVENGSSTESASLVQRQWTGGPGGGGGSNNDDRRWELDIVDSGAYRITNVRSGYVADVEGWGGEGTSVIQYGWKGPNGNTTNQVWVLKPV